MPETLDLNKYVDEVSLEEEKSDMHYSLFAIPDAYKDEEEMLEISDEISEIHVSRINNSFSYRNLKETLCKK